MLKDLLAEPPTEVPQADGPAPTAIVRGNSPCVSVLASVRSALKGGVYDPATALALANSHFFLARVKGAYPIAQINEDRSIVYVSEKDFKLKFANMFVRVDDGHGGKKKVSGARFWLSHEHRDEREVIFDTAAPAGAARPGVYNQWSGFAIQPRAGTRKIRRLLRHLFQVICRREKTKFKYLIRWLAWAVQHPDQNPGTVIVLKSEHQGTGKTTVNTWMCRISW